MTDVYDGSLDNAYDTGVRDGYRRGEMERVVLAQANSDLRSELLALRQELARYTIDEGHG